MVKNEVIDRLNRLIETAELEHKVARLHGGGGNREFESTSGAISALKGVKETLTAENDPTLEDVEAHAVRNTVRLKIFGVLTILKNQGITWLHIGDLDELKDNQKPEIIDTVIEHEILETFRGTRIEVLQQFLEKYGV